MIRNKITAGTAVLDSDNIISTDYKTAIISGDILEPGTVFSAEITLRVYGGSAPFSEGQQMTLESSYDEGATYRQIGIFYADKPTVERRGVWKFSAYDSVHLLDIPVNDYLNDVTFPVSLGTLIRGMCVFCGVELLSDEFPNYNFQVWNEGNALTGPASITGRQVMSWAAQLAGCYVTALPNGTLGFFWLDSASYTSRGMDVYASVTVDGSSLSNVGTVICPGVAEIRAGGNLLEPDMYYMDSLTLENRVAPSFDGVVVAGTDILGAEKVSVPALCANPYIINWDNLLLAGAGGDIAQYTAVANRVRAALSVTYMPFTVMVFPRCDIPAGLPVGIVDSAGNVYTSIALNVSRTPSGIQITAPAGQYEAPTFSGYSAVTQALANAAHEVASFLGANGGAVRVLDTNGDGVPDELYIADNPEPASAQRVWRFNYMGWAASENGYAGPFEMGATLENGLLANFVTAARLVAGTIRSKDWDEEHSTGSFFMDLDTGEVQMNVLSLKLGGADINSVINIAIDEAETNFLERNPGEYATQDDVTTVENALSTRIEGDEAGLRAVTTYTNGIQGYVQVSGDELTLGKSDSAFKQVLSSTKNSFMDGDVEVAYISNQELNINRATIQQNLKLDGKWQIDYANGFSIRWVG